MRAAYAREGGGNRVRAAASGVVVSALRYSRAPARKPRPVAAKI